MFERSERITNLNAIIDKVKKVANTNKKVEATKHTFEFDIKVDTISEQPVLTIDLKEKRTMATRENPRQSSMAVMLSYDEDVFEIGQYSGTSFRAAKGDRVSKDQIGTIIVADLLTHLER